MSSPEGKEPQEATKRFGVNNRQSKLSNALNRNQQSQSELQQRGSTRGFKPANLTVGISYGVTVLALIGVLVCLFHTIQTEAVLYAYGLFACTFVLTAVLCSLQAVQVVRGESAEGFLGTLLNLLPSWKQFRWECHLQIEEQHRMEQQYRMLTDNMAAAIVIRDIEGAILYCSPYSEILTGYSIEEMYQRADSFFSDITFEEDREKVDRSLNVSKYGEAFQFRYRFYHKTGLLMWAETRTVPLLDEDGDTQGLLSMTFDITGSMRYQEKVEEHNKDLEDFSYMLSHDLKSPIVTIQGMLTAIMQDYTNELPGDVHELLQHSEKATDRLLSLVKSILEYSRIANLSSESSEVDAHEVAQQVLEELSFQLEKVGAVVRIEALPMLIGDRNMLYHVFLNLLENAIKYREPTRPLEITLQAIPNESPSAVTVEISDNGQGIPAERIADIFLPFKRAHGKEIEGSGIGLACVKKMLERMSGSITVESTQGTGSRFNIHLRSLPHT